MTEETAIQPNVTATLSTPAPICADSRASSGVFPSFPRKSAYGASLLVESRYVIPEFAKESFVAPIRKAIMPAPSRALKRRRFPLSNLLPRIPVIENHRP